MAEAASGGRTWWAHIEFTRINIEPIILKNKFEEQLIVGRVLPPDQPLPSLDVSTRSSIGICRPREERFIRLLNQAGDRAVPD